MTPARSCLWLDSSVVCCSLGDVWVYAPACCIYNTSLMFHSYAKPPRFRPCYAMVPLSERLSLRTEAPAPSFAVRPSSFLNILRSSSLSSSNLPPQAIPPQKEPKMCDRSYIDRFYLLNVRHTAWNWFVDMSSLLAYPSTGALIAQPVPIA